MITIAIIGAGPLGRWLALAAARAGFRVFLEDVMPSNLHHAQEYLRRQLSPENADTELRNALSEEDGQSKTSGFVTGHDFNRAETIGMENGALAPAPVHFVSTVEDAVREADLAVDCVPDELESKLEILWLLDRMAPPKTVIVTPTTNLSIVDLASCTYRPEKCIAITAAPRTLSDERPGSTIQFRTTSRTAPETIALVRSFWERLGFHPEFDEAAHSQD